MTPINDTEKCEHCHETGGGHYWDCWYDQTEIPAWTPEDDARIGDLDTTW